MSNLDLIDWRHVGFSALWILGLAVILAAFSFADYEASVVLSGALNPSRIRSKASYLAVMTA